MGNRELNLMQALLIFLLIALVIPANCIKPEGEIERLKISMMLVNQRDGSSENVTDKNILLTTERIIFKERDTIDTILISRGILPDGESLGILYEINPGIDEKTIKAGAALIIPVIRGAKDIPIISKEGYLLALTLDKEMKQAFLKELRTLDNSVEKIDSAPVELFGSSAAKGEFTQTIKSAAEQLGAFGIVLRERTRPLSSEMIRQVHDEARQLNMTLNKLNKDSQILKKSDLEIIKLIIKNMDIRMRTLYEKKGPGELPSRWPAISVIVKTIDLKQNKEVHNLRIYYVSVALWENRKDYERSFDKLTSPAVRVLPEANYYIWAGKPNDSTPLSDKKLIEVRKKEKNEKIELDLAIY